MRWVPIKFAKEGMQLAQTLYDTNNRILLYKGVKLTERLIDKIKENGVYSLYVQDEYSDFEMEDIISPKIRNAAVKTVKETFECVSAYYNKNTSPTKIKKILEIREEKINDLKTVSENILEEIFTQKNLMIHLVDIKRMDDYTYQHSVNVAILSLVLGIEMGLNKIELKNLCIGCMLHDIGKGCIPNDILKKTTPWSEEEKRVIKDHPTQGYEYLKERNDFHGVIRLITLQHHEKVDGSGYPKGLKGDRIHKLSKIVAITDTYDCLTSDTPQKRGISPNEALEFILGSAGRYFDYEMVRIFSKKVVPYPIGTLVQLSDGQIGVVQQVRENFPLRPTVKIVKQKATKIEINIIDLMKHTNLIISKVLYEVPNACVPRQIGDHNSFKKIIQM